MMNLLDYICCPCCKEGLRNDVSYLSCDACLSRYPVVEGVPNFVDQETINAQQKDQLKYFKHEKGTRNFEHNIEPWQKKYLERFIKNNPEIKGKVIADCGTGSAYMAIELAKLGAIVIATDLSFKSVLRLKIIAKELALTDTLICICTVAEQLPFHNSVIDIFISNSVLEHLHDEVGAIAEMNRVCTPKAELMIAIPIAYRYLNPLFIPLNYVHDKRIGHLRRYDEGSMQRKFSNWKMQRIYYTGHTIKVLKIIINLLFPVFDLQQIEKDDARLENGKWMASNIICFLSRVPS